MSKLIKLLIVFAVIAGLFMYYPASTGDEEPKPTLPAAQTQTEQQTTSAQSLKETESTLMTLLPYLPERSTWPDPLQKMFMLFTLENTVKERTAGMEWTPLPEIPTAMQQALVAIEDHDFYRHGAVALDGILRATFVNLYAGEIVQGGSTLTQQLAKNMFLSQEQTMSRKVYEVMFALMLEDKYSKDQILEMYFNTTYFGNGATGITAAARSYFGKTPAEMNLAECAVIASLPYAPSALNPYENPEGCKKRQHIVLDTMVKRGFIGETVANAAKEKTVYLADGTAL